METYFSIPNIDDSNNLLQITNSKVWSDVKIETGCYGLVSLNTSISRKLEVLDMTKAVQFEANYSTFKCIMNIKKGFLLIFLRRNMTDYSKFEHLVFQFSSYEMKLKKKNSHS